DLSRHPAVIEAAQRAIAEYGVSATASPRTSGHLAIHEQLERALAEFLGKGDVVLVAAGYLAPLAALTTLSADHDVVVVAPQSHAAIADAVVATGLPPRSMGECRPGTVTRPLLVTAGLDWSGQVAPLQDYWRRSQATGGRLVVDEAHATGILGPQGRGSVEWAGIEDPEVVLTGSLAKALGAAGGFVAGTDAFIRRLRGANRSYAAATALAPALAAAALAALRIVQREPERRARLHENATALRQRLRARGLSVTDEAGPSVVPARFDPELTRRIHESLRASGFLVSLIGSPYAPDGPRLRFVAKAGHTEADYDRLLSAMPR
ncbi:MAG: pyridoxal phosphate-dependent aminotransferase family protein, partial [Planctomycetes bacterium]|nr:pyridoxal phosphate-dependent aminotransferase family protein [Planctomycetota bacterium]